MKRVMILFILAVNFSVCFAQTGGSKTKSIYFMADTVHVDSNGHIL